MRGWVPVWEEMGALTGETYLPSVSYTACEDGASLLTWPVDSFLRRHLHRLPGLVTNLWVANSALAFLAIEPRLVSHLTPRPVEELPAAAPDGATLVVVVGGGELIDDVASVDVKHAASTAPSPAPPKRSPAPPRRRPRLPASRDLNPTDFTPMSSGRNTPACSEYSEAGSTGASIAADLEVTVQLHSVQATVSHVTVICNRHM